MYLSTFIMIYIYVIPAIYSTGMFMLLVHVIILYYIIVHISYYMYIFYILLLNYYL